MEINRHQLVPGPMKYDGDCLQLSETVPDCNGHSSVFDGIAYLPESDASRDTCILQTDGQEGIYIAELDLEQLRSYRESEVHGNAYRHPKNTDF